MFFVYRSDDDEELADDEEATLADEVLDELGDEDDEIDPLTEGFGELPEDSDDDEEEDDESEETSLEEDAEDVDFDTFDDIDEM